MKKGSIYYHAFISDASGEKKVQIWEYVLRTIRGGKGYLVVKDKFTWGKKSAKHGDFGWLDPVPDWCRESFKLDDGVPSGFGLSKSAAIRSALADARKDLARWKVKGDAEDIADEESAIELLTRRLKREGKK